MGPGVDPSAVLAALGSEGLEAGKRFGEWVAGPNGAAGGATTSVVATLEPGNYIVACVIPDPSGTPHAMKGMLSDLTVTEASGEISREPAGLPQVSLAEYHFELPDGFDGTGPVVVVNGGNEVHEAVVAKLAPGKTVADVVEFENQPYPRTGTAPYTLVTGTTFIGPGGSARLDLDLDAGEYVWICFIPGPEGEAHYALGMVHPFTVG
jgi:hypothetical protein